MIRLLIATVLCFVPWMAMGEWRAHFTEDGHWISVLSPAGHQFVVAEHEDEVQMLLVLAVSGDQIAGAPDKGAVRIDEGEWAWAPLLLLRRSQEGMAFRFGFREEVEKDLIERMIRGLRLQVGLGAHLSGGESLSFSLIGFTNAWNDMLIANRIGTVDIGELVEQNRVRELVCYAMADWSVTALRARIRGSSREEALRALRPTGIDLVDELMPDTVRWAWEQPADSQFMRHPAAHKYEFFERCMSD